MIGSSVVMKAAKKGYKRYGIPGAVVAGGGALLGIRFVKQRFLSGNEGTDDATDSSASDAESTQA